MLSHLFLHWCHKLPAQSLLPSLESCSTTCPGTPEKQGTPERQGSSLKTAAPDDPRPHFFLLIWGSPGWAKAGAQLPLSNDPATIAQPTSLCHVAQGIPGGWGQARGWQRGRRPPVSTTLQSWRAEAGTAVGLGNTGEREPCVAVTSILLAALQPLPTTHIFRVICVLAFFQPGPDNEFKLPH